MTTTVVNKRHAGGWESRSNGVYIGRGSKWGNPFKIGQDGSRAEVITKYIAYLKTRPDLIAALPEIRGKILVCYCAPLACHGDVLARLADVNLIMAAPNGIITTGQEESKHA